MAHGSKAVALLLTGKGHEALLGPLWQRSAGRTAAMRARIVRACAEPDMTDTAVAERLGVSCQNVLTLRQRFLSH